MAEEQTEFMQWQVGDVRVTSVPESQMATSPRFLYDGLTKDDVSARAEASPWLGPFVNDAGYLVQRIQCLVIETGDMVIAVDTCIGNDKERGNDLWRHLEGPFLDDMTRAGFAPEAVTHVVCTHIHVDHVGWNTRLVDGAWVPTFPNARYLFVRPELEHSQTRADEGAEEDDYFGDSVAPIVDAGLADVVALDHRVNEHVALVPTVGHTPGHVSVEIRSDHKRAIITGDMLHNPLQFADPDVSSIFDSDQSQARRTRWEVFPGWADGETLVIGTHFAAPTAGVLRAQGESFRFET